MTRDGGIEQALSFLAALIRGVWSVVRSGRVLLPYALSQNPDELHKEITEQYPDPVSARTADELPARTRGLLHNDYLKCTGCGDCVSVCPASCIELDTEPGPDSNNLWIAEFKVDFSKCLFCGLCVEACQPQSLTHRKEFEMLASTPAGLIKDFGRGHVTREQRTRWEEQRRQDAEERLQ